MPVMSGFEVLQALRANAPTRRIPVIIHTSRVLEEAERAALTHQGAWILPKENLSREVALDRLREALARAGLGTGPTGDNRV
jgi:CheY-like chemotaxis protein